LSLLVSGRIYVSKFEDKNLSKKFSAEMEFRKIDPWTVSFFWEVYRPLLLGELGCGLSSVFEKGFESFSNLLPTSCDGKRGKSGSDLAFSWFSEPGDIDLRLLSFCESSVSL
jgi:hypothetical protein